MMSIYDEQGEERTFKWLTSNFGPVTIHTPPDFDHTYEITELKARTAPAAIIVTVLDRAGQPLPNIPTVWDWPDAPALPDAGWYETGVIGPTNEQGNIGHAMGEGAYYKPPTPGPHSLWIFGANMSQMISGLGMIADTKHRHLDVTFQLKAPTPPPPQLDLLTLQDINIDIARTQRNIGRAAEHAARAGELVSQLIARFDNCEVPLPRR